MKPTIEQTEKFWEWCGFKQLPKGNRFYHFEQTRKVMDWQAPSSETIPYLPSLDLNNLFKYAVPKLITLGYDCLISTSEDFYECEICDSRFPPVKQAQLKQDKDPALALFWAIYKVIEEETET